MRLSKRILTLAVAAIVLLGGLSLAALRVQGASLGADGGKGGFFQPVLNVFSEREGNDGDEDWEVVPDNTAVPQAAISADQAKAAALAANPGTTVAKVEQAKVKDAPVYAVTLSDHREVKVDATNGQVLSTEQPGADQDDDGD